MRILCWFAAPGKRNARHPRVRAIIAAVVIVAAAGCDQSPKKQSTTQPSQPTQGYTPDPSPSPPTQRYLASPPLQFHGYSCTDDCSGHEAGYEWAEENGIDDPDDCGGNSDSFIEGCQAYADEQVVDNEEDDAEAETDGE